MGNKKDAPGQKPKKPQQDGPQAPQNCAGPDCKKKQARFGFCLEHFDQFKFGLITKAGKPVPDYDKKFEHYAAYKEKQQVQKVA